MEALGKVAGALFAAAVTWVGTFVLFVLIGGAILSGKTGQRTITGTPAFLMVLGWWLPPVIVFVNMSGIWDAIVSAWREQKSSTDAKVRAAREAKERRRAAVDVEKKAFSQQIEDIQEFFGTFIANAQPLQRDKFETKVEYAARLPSPVNLTQSFYFPLAGKEFLYSVEMGIATFVSASYFRRDYAELRLPSVEERSGSHTTWTNAFGAKFSVSVIRKREYEILIYNHKAVPKALRCEDCLGCSVRLDRVYARENEHYLRLVAGVRFIDWKRNHHKSFHERPEFPIGLETYWDQYQIDGYLSSLHLINTNTSEQLRHWQIH